jgi:hypothetical protein
LGDLSVRFSLHQTDGRIARVEVFATRRFDHWLESCWSALYGSASIAAVCGTNWSVGDFAHLTARAYQSLRSAHEFNNLYARKLKKLTHANQIKEDALLAADALNIPKPSEVCWCDAIACLALRESEFACSCMHVRACA